MWPQRAVVRRDTGLWCYERTLQRYGFDTVAGTDEAGRGASAGPLVVGAVVLPPGPRGQVPGLADSKLLTAPARERVYGEVVRRALAWSAVVVPAAEIDRLGIHVVNIRAMRQALASLSVAPQFVLSDGFAVPGLPWPGLGVPKGDRVAACVAAASVIAKVTRDAMMVALDTEHPGYDFARHKGYNTADHLDALDALGPCPEHRRSWITVSSRGHLRAAPRPMGETAQVTDVCTYVTDLEGSLR